MRSLVVSLLLFACFAAYGQSSNIMDCSVEVNGSNGELYLYLTDTLLVSGFSVKVGTGLDAGDLFNQQYSKASLPASASLDYNTLYLPLGTLSYSGVVYVWVRVLLSTGGYYEIKVNPTI